MTILLLCLSVVSTIKRSVSFVNRYLVVCTADPLTRTVTPNSPTTTTISESTSHTTDYTSSTQPGKADPGYVGVYITDYTVHVCARKVNLY